MTQKWQRRSAEQQLRQQTVIFSVIRVSFICVIKILKTGQGSTVGEIDFTLQITDLWFATHPDFVSKCR